MGILYITEYPTAGVDQGRAMPVGQGAPIANQTVSYSTSTQSAAFNANTKLIRVHTDSICSILIGTNPTATTSTARMVAGQTEYFGVDSTMKIAAVTNT